MVRRETLLLDQLDILFLSMNHQIAFVKQKTAYEMRISDWSSDVCSSDLATDWKTAMPGEITLPHYFKQNGYRTEGAGKIFHHHLNGAFHDSTALDRKSVV